MMILVNILENTVQKNQKDVGLKLLKMEFGVDVGEVIMKNTGIE